jgi:hypothetical protein
MSTRGSRLNPEMMKAYEGGALTYETSTKNTSSTKTTTMSKIIVKSMSEKN